VPVLAAAAIAIAGCADSRVAGTNPSNANAQASNDQSEQPYKTGYGFTSDGPTTDLYSELFGSSRRDAAPPPAAPQPVEPVVASTPIQPVQPATKPAAKQKAQRATATATNRQVQPTNPAVATQQVQPAPAPATAQAIQPQAAQQPAAPQAPAEADTPAAYGITSSGPTTDLYTALFGPRRRDGQ
jgi:outer membrane biosynthesis protein TonB